MTRSVFDRQTDGLQYAAGIANALCFAAIFWAICGAMLVWALR